MPSVSKKQHNLMAMVANDSGAAKRLGISQDVGKEFVAADKGKKFRKGGIPADINKPKTHHTDGGVPNYSTRKVAGFNGGGMAKSKEMSKEAACAPGGVVKKPPTGKQMGMLGMKTGGHVANERKELHRVDKQLKRNERDMAESPSARSAMRMSNERDELRRVDMNLNRNEGMKSGGMAKVRKTQMVKMCKGGGVEVKGKTKGRMV